jgi:hypothetical protein
LEHVYCGVHAHCGKLLSVDDCMLAMSVKKMEMKKKEEEEEKTMMMTKTTS